MNSEIIAETARRTLIGEISFPEAVKNLLEAGVEYYHVDYMGMRKAFYGGDGASVVTPINFEGMPPVNADFSQAKLRANILDSQTNGQSFREFSRRAVECGVQSYYAFLRGQRVTYMGRQGDQHTEWFPGAGPE